MLETMLVRTLFLLSFCLLSAYCLAQSSSYLHLDYVGDGLVGHQLDIYLPDQGEGPYPVVVAIYGSAFFNPDGKTGTYQVVGEPLLKAGFALVAINHRSSREAIFPAQLHDIKAAVRFVRAHAAKYRLDPSFIAATGWSSGGHLSAFLGTTGNLPPDLAHLEGNLGPHTDQSSAVDAVVDWYGPTDFLIMDECGSAMHHDTLTSPESILVGGPIQDNPDLCRQANPATYVDAEDPPFLILHGTDDPLVPLCQSEVLQAAFNQAEGYSTLIVVYGGGHGPGVLEAPYLGKMVRFFSEEWKKRH
jgi:acetyl esterase/lipase